MATPRNKLERQYGWPGWVVPCDMLADELLSRVAELKFEDRCATEDNDTGWRAILGARVAAIAGVSEQAVVRRLFDIENKRQMVVGANIAESMLLAVGALLDRDTNIPTLPGCKSAAVEMADVHADIHDPTMTLAERAKLAESLLNFSIGFICGESWLDAQEQEQEAELVAA